MKWVVREELGTSWQSDPAQQGQTRVRNYSCGLLGCGRSRWALLGSEVLPGNFVSCTFGEEHLGSPWPMPFLLCRELLPVSGGRGTREERGWGCHHVHPQL